MVIKFKFYTIIWLVFKIFQTTTPVHPIVATALCSFCYQLVRNWYEVIEAMGVLRSKMSSFLVMLRVLLARIINAIEKKNYLEKTNV